MRKTYTEKAKSPAQIREPSSRNHPYSIFGKLLEHQQKSQIIFIQFPNSFLCNSMCPLPHNGSLGGRSVHSDSWYSLRIRNMDNSWNSSRSKHRNSFPKKAIKCSSPLAVRLHMYDRARRLIY